MSFNAEVKNEILTSVTTNNCCQLAMLSAIIRSAGSIEVTDGVICLSVKTGNVKVATFTQYLLDKLFGIATTIDKSVKTKRHTLYEIWVFDALNALDQCKIAYIDNGKLKLYEGINKQLIEKDCCAKSYIKAMFLGCGSVVVPQVKTLATSCRGGYHLEFALTNFQATLDLYGLLKRFNFEGALGSRKDINIIYIKSSETISDFMALLGAGKAVLDIQNIIIEKALRNNVNRASNCEYANIDRVLDAAQKQIIAINKLIKSGELYRLTDKLQQAAQLRLCHQTESLDELCAIIDGTVSKSGLNHRLRKLIELADE